MKKLALALVIVFMFAVGGQAASEIIIVNVCENEYSDPIEILNDFFMSYEPRFKWLKINFKILNPEILLHNCRLLDQYLIFDDRLLIQVDIEESK